MPLPALTVIPSLSKSVKEMLNWKMLLSSAIAVFAWILIISLWSGVSFAINIGRILNWLGLDGAATDIIQLRENAAESPWWVLAAIAGAVWNAASAKNYSGATLSWGFLTVAGFFIDRAVLVPFVLGLLIPFLLNFIAAVLRPSRLPSHVEKPVNGDRNWFTLGNGLYWNMA